MLQRYLAFEVIMKLTILIIVLFFNFTVYSQDKITGEIVDAENKVIPYASLIIEGTNIGTITNSEGLFTLMKNSAPNCSVLISCLGYKSYRLNIDDNIKYPVKIILENETFNLSEVTIKPVDAKAIVKKAISKIDENYPRNTIKINGVYKQLTSINDQMLLYLKSNINVYLKGMGRNWIPQIQSEALDYEFYKNNRAFIKPNSILLNLWLYHHPIISHFNNFSYYYENKMNFEGNSIIKIRFKPSKINDEKAQFQGFVYIDEETYGFAYIEYSKIPNNTVYTKKDGALQKNIKIDVKLMFTKSKPYYEINYLITSVENQILVDDKTFLVNNVSNFFSKGTDINQKINVADRRSLDEILIHEDGKVIEKSKNYIDDFILETSKEKELKIKFME